MPIVRHDLAYILTGMRAEDLVTKTTTHSSATGPGYHSIWMFMGHSDNSFLELEVTRATSNKKKIIFNAGLLKERVLSFYEIEVISSLISQYEVYVLPNRNTPLASLKPVSALSEFMEARLIQPTMNKDDIEVKLAEQGISAKSFIIIDQSYYSEMMARYVSLQKKTNGPGRETQNLIILEDQRPGELQLAAENGINMLDPATKENVARSINPYKTHTLLTDEKTIGTSLPLISQVETIKFTDARNINCLKNNLSVLANKAVIININNKNEAKQDLIIDLSTPNKDTGNLKSLMLSVKQALGDVSIVSINIPELKIMGEQIKEFMINPNCEIERLSLQFAYLKGMTLNPGLKSFSFTHEGITTYLNIDHFNKIDLTNQRLLEELHLSIHSVKRLEGVNPGLKSLSLSRLHELEKFQIAAFTQLQKVELSETKINIENLPASLIEIKLSKIAIEGNDFLQQLVQLERLTLKSLKLPTLNLQSQFALKELNIKEVKSLEVIDLQNSKALQEIHFENCDQLITINNLTSNLKTINIVKCNNLTELDLKNKSNLLKLVIAHCYTLPSLDLSQCTSVEVLKLYLLRCTNFDLTKCQKLKNIEIDTLYCLEEMEINSSELKTLCVRNCEKLKKLDLSSSPKLQSLRLEKMNLSVVILPPQIKMLSLREVDNISLLQHANLKFLEELELNGRDNANHDLVLAELNLPNLKRIKLDHFGFLDCDLSSFNNLEELTLNYSDRRLTKWPQGQVNAVKINASGSLFLDLTNLKVEELTINYRYQYYRNDQEKDPFISWPKENHIRKLELNFTNATLDLSQFNDLEMLVIREASPSRLKSIIFPKNSKLKYVEMNDCSLLTSFNIEDCKHLENVKLEFVCLPKIDLSKQPTLLEVLVGSASDHPMQIELSSSPLLRKVTIESSTADVNLKLSSTPRLNELKVECTQNLTIDTLNDSPYLNKLYLKSQNINVLHQTILVGLPQTVDIKLHAVTQYSAEQKLQDDKQIQNILNAKNPTSIFSLRHTASVDMNTGLPPAYSAKGEFKLTMYSQKNVQRDKYRIISLNKLKYANGKLTFYEELNGFKSVPFTQKAVFNADLISAQKALIDKDPNLFLSLFEGKFAANEYYPLPLMLPSVPLNLDLYTDPKSAVNLFWNDEHKQYYFKVNPAFANKKLSLLYCASYSPTKIAEENAATELLTVKQPLLPNDLAQKLRAKLNTPNSPVSFLFDPALNLTQKLAQLQHYMTIIYEPADIRLNFFDDADNIAARILNHKGVCRHRTQDFALCAFLLGIPVLIKENEEHSIIEVPYVIKGEVIHKSIDLGGGERLDLTPLAARDNPLGTATKTPSQTTVNLPPLAHLKPRTALQQYYDEQFYAIAQASQVSNLLHLWTNANSKPPLIQIPTNQTAFSVNKAIAIHLRNLKMSPPKHIYIDKPNDFMFYLYPWKYVDGVFVAEPRGPLTDLMEKGGVLVINWSSFSAREIAIYKSILEKEPTLNGQKVSTKLRVIGLASLGTESCSAFLSRTQPYSLHDDFFPSEKVKHPSKVVEIIEVDLFKCLDWREKLLGKENYINNKSQLLEGPLIEAIRLNKCLRIINPPADRDFELLMHRVQDERKLFFNNEFIKVGDDCTIELLTKDHPITLPNVHIDTLSLPNKNLTYLSVQNLYECYERVVINNGKKMPFASLLESYNPLTDVFYITDFIPQHEWQRLLFEIKTYYKDKTFAFHLGPHGEIEGVAKSGLVPKQVVLKSGEVIPPSAAVVTTNDPDFLSNQLAKEDKDPLIVDVSPLTRFNELMYEVELIKQPDKTAHFIHTEKGVLKALASGRPVILNGELSAGLYQQLLPWLSGQKTFDNNDVKIPITAKLTAVMPVSARDHLLLVEDTQRDLGPADYEKIIPAKHQENYQRILAFYQLANKLPHTGLGRPTPPQINSQRLQQMLSALEEKPSSLHRHNPIKSVFLYDYPRYSDDYAYLNVMAKAIFMPKDNSDFHEEKLLKLMARFDLTNFAEFKKHYWKILNCFNGRFLNNMLGANFKELNFSEAFPALSDAGIKRLHKHILGIQAHREQWKLQTIATCYRNEKQAQQFRAALADPSHLVINIKGEAGVGKTNTIGAVLKEYHVGEKGISDWLMKGGVLYLDEPNLAKPGTWDFLKGISRRSVFYKGVEYPLKPDQKVVTSFNPEHYPNRFYHRFLQEYGTTLYFAKYDDAFMRERILAPILQPAGLAKFNYLDGLLTAFHLINEFQPFLPVSTRDLENLAHRFKVLVNSSQGSYPDDQINEQALLAACIHEFSGAIKEAAERERFIMALETKLNIKRIARVLPPIIHVTATHRLTPEKAYLLDAIEQDFLMRNQQIAEIKALRKTQADKKLTQELPQPYYKYGILLEGESGVGKSSLYKAILKRNLDRELGELKKSIPDQTSQAFLSAATEIYKRWQYYEITAGDPIAAANLTKAAHEGAWVILDELNLDKALEELLNQLLTGKDMEGKPLANPGLRVLSSQNPGNYAGREPLSPAVLNRFHLLQMNTFSDKELTAIADSYLPGQGEIVVDSFRKVEKKYQHSINTRTFFESLSTIKPAPKELLANVFTTQIKPLSPEEAQGKKYYDEFLADLQNNIPLLRVIDHYKTYKETIIKFIDTLDEPIRLKIYNEILDRRNSLGKLMHASTGTVALSAAKDPVLTDVQQKRDVLHKKLSIANAPKP